MSASPAATVLAKTATAFAITGGLLLCALATLTVISILGRALFSLPVPGDFELVAVGTGISAFLSLPYCQLRRGHLRVDLFGSRVSPRVSGALDALAGLLAATIAALFAVRMLYGLIDAVRDRDVSVILGLPLWWAYPFAIASFALLAACCVYTAREDLKRARRAPGDDAWTP